jgi:cell division protein FtsQ
MAVSRRGWLVGAAGVALLATAAPAVAPLLLRQLPWFAARRVEISGTRLLAPHEVLAAARVRPGHNVWDDTGALEEALRGHPAIAAATVQRRLPSTLRIRVQEKHPVAFVEMGALAPITREGELLPLDPARTPIDLPVIRGSWADADRTLRSQLLRETDRLARLDPALLAEVSEIRPAEGSRVLILSHALADIVIPVGATPGRLAQLRAVLADLERRAPAGAAPARVDLRFGEQIVVRLPSSV